MKTGSSSGRTSAAAFCPDGPHAGGRALGAAALLLAAAPLAAQGIDQRLPISLDAESSVVDLRNNQSIFEGLRISQGAIGIEADKGITVGTKRRDFGDSTWTFEGNVRIDIETAKIASDAAELVFRDHTLQRATVRGDPATFEDRGRRDGAPISASADRFEYDLNRYVVRFSGEARILEGDNEISGADLVYDIEQQRVNFRGDVETGERVRITIVPDDLRERLDDDGNENDNNNQ